MKTQKEIQSEIKALKSIRSKVRSRSVCVFDADNLAQLDAQVAVLENNLDDDEIYDRYDHSGMDEEVLMAAQDARQWIEGESDIEKLSEGWPMNNE